MRMTISFEDIARDMLKQSDFYLDMTRNGEKNFDGAIYKDMDPVKTFPLMAGILEGVDLNGSETYWEKLISRLENFPKTFHLILFEAIVERAVCEKGGNHAKKLIAGWLDKNLISDEYSNFLVESSVDRVENGTSPMSMARLCRRVAGRSLFINSVSYNLSNFAKRGESGCLIGMMERFVKYQRENDCKGILKESEREIRTYAENIKGNDSLAATGIEMTPESLAILLTNTELGHHRILLVASPYFKKAAQMLNQTVLDELKISFNMALKETETLSANKTANLFAYWEKILLTLQTPPQKISPQKARKKL